jgi:type II secretory pathway pseudopilin PulG
MLKPISIRRRCRPSEEGYLLLAVMCMLAILVISMSVAAPLIKKSIQRDRDVETMQRGKQFIRAIKLYYKKFGSYPPNIDALVKTNNIRFLRKKYIDPTSGKDEWKPIRFGQNKTPTAMGFFGQPLAGSTLAGIGPTGGNGLNGTSTNNGLSGSSSLTNSTDTTATTPGTTSTTGTDANGNPTSGSGLTGQSFGGGGIIGFSPTSPRQSILVYKKKNHYNEWEFTYDPLQEQMMMQGSSNGINGQPAGSSTPGFGGTTGIGGGTGIGGSGIGGGSGFGGSTGGSNPGGSTPISPQQ